MAKIFHTNTKSQNIHELMEFMDTLLLMCEALASITGNYLRHLNLEIQILDNHFNGRRTENKPKSEKLLVEKEVSLIK